MSFYKIIRAIFKPIVTVIFRIHCHGEENVPEEGGLLICSNHISATDVIFITCAVKKRQVHYMAKAEVFKVPVLKQFATAMGAFPIKRGTGDVAAIKKTIAMLKNGETVGVFPQGTRYAGVHPKDSEVKPGVGMMAWRSKTNVLPIAIITKDYRIKPFSRIDVIIGKPISCDDLGFESGNHEEQVKAANIIFGKILKLHEEGVPKK